MPRLQAFAAVLAVIALGSVPIAAQAYDTAKLHVTFSPYELGKETTLNIHVTIANSNGGVPSPVTSFNTRMPPNVELVGSTLGLAICAPSALLAKGLEGCSPNARLGSGSALVEVPFGPEIASETASVEALMGPPAGENVGILLYAEGRSPIFAQTIFPGLLLLGSGPLGESLDTNLPLTPTLPGSADASVTSMTLRLGPEHLTYYKKVHGRTVGYRPQGIALPKKCPPHGFEFISELAFQEGTTQTVTSTVACPSSGHHGRRRA
jgi:hypothetical protein